LVATKFFRKIRIHIVSFFIGTLYLLPSGTALGAESNLQASLSEFTQKIAWYWKFVHKHASSVVAIAVPERSMNSKFYFQAEIKGPRLASNLTRVNRTTGSGVIIDSEGFILTNHHVIQKGIQRKLQIWVTTDDGTVYPAMVVGSDPFVDLAILKIPGHGMPVANFSTREVKRNEGVVAMGNPYGRSMAGQIQASIGSVIETNKFLGAIPKDSKAWYTHLIAVTAQVLPGQSGGPLFGLDGNVIGITTTTRLNPKDKELSEVGFAIPVTERFLNQINQLKHGKKNLNAWLGIIFRPLDLDEASRRNRFNRKNGVVVDEILEKGPASSILQKGDILLEMNGVDIVYHEFTERIAYSSTSETTKFYILRDNELLKREVVFEIQNDLPDLISKESQFFVWNGLVLKNASGKFSEEGVQVGAVKKNSKIQTIVFQKGDIITSLGDRKIKNLFEFQEAVYLTSPENLKLIKAESALASTQN